VGNGDPNCQESDKEPKRSLFNGLAQVILQASKNRERLRWKPIRNAVLDQRCLRRP